MRAPSQPLDAITAFAAPNPNCSSQSQSVFSGLAAQQVALPSWITQPTLDWLMLFEPILSIVDVPTLVLH